jgi:6-phosphogluconolactonase
MMQLHSERTNNAVEIVADPDALAQRAAERLIAAASETQGDFAIALSGGATARPLYELLARAPYREAFPWQRTHVFWGDERFVLKSDARSNSRMAYEALLSHVPIPATNVHAVPTEGMTPAEAALAYERTLKTYYGAERLDPRRPLFDVALLGLGEDGHIASLFPATSALSERERWVVAVTEGVPEPRITLTYPPLENSALVLFLVVGEDKRAILARVCRGDEKLPAARLSPHGPVLWLADAAAAGQPGENAKSQLA